LAEPGPIYYVRGRTYKKRLETNVSGEWFENDGIYFLSGSVHLKNVGLAKFPIEQKGTAVLIYDLHPSSSTGPAADLVETLITVRSAFKDHGWIEPNETIEESFLIQIGSSERRAGIKLSLRVVAAHIEWNANRIILPTAFLGPPAGSSLMIGTHNSVETGGVMSEREKSENTFPGKPGSTVPVTTQIDERPDVTEQIERQKQTPLNDDEGRKPTQRFD